MGKQVGRISSKFRQLLLNKQAQAGRAISYREVSAETGVALSILQKWAGDKVLRYSGETMARLCAFFSCGPGDLLEYIPPPAAPRTRKGDGRPGG